MCQKTEDSTSQSKKDQSEETPVVNQEEKTTTIGEYTKLLEDFHRT